MRHTAVAAVASVATAGCVPSKKGFFDFSILQSFADDEWRFLGLLVFVLAGATVLVVREWLKTRQLDRADERRHQEALIELRGRIKIEMKRRDNGELFK